MKPDNISEVSRKKWELVEIRVPPGSLQRVSPVDCILINTLAKKLPEDRRELHKGDEENLQKGHSTNSQRKLVFPPRGAKPCNT